MAAPGHFFGAFSLFDRELATIPRVGFGINEKARHQSRAFVHSQMA
jgi:hypothetical protein